MKRLIKPRLRHTRPLAMDKYDRFIEEALRDAVDRDAYPRGKKLREVNVPFRL